MLNLFAWPTDLGALGVIILMALTSVAVLAYLRKHSDLTEATIGHEVSAAVAAVALAAVAILAIGNFGALLGTTPDDPLRWILPGIVVAAGVVGWLYGLYLKSARPAVYAGVGRGGVLDVD